MTISTTEMVERINSVLSLIKELQSCIGNDIAAGARFGFWEPNEGNYGISGIEHPWSLEGSDKDKLSDAFGSIYFLDDQPVRKTIIFPGFCRVSKETARVAKNLNVAKAEFAATYTELKKQQTKTQFENSVKDMEKTTSGNTVLSDAMRVTGIKRLQYKQAVRKIYILDEDDHGHADRAKFFYKESGEHKRTTSTDELNRIQGLLEKTPTPQLGFAYDQLIKLGEGVPIAKKRAITKYARANIRTVYDDQPSWHIVSAVLPILIVSEDLDLPFSCDYENLDPDKPKMERSKRSNIKIASEPIFSVAGTDYHLYLSGK